MKTKGTENQVHEEAMFKELKKNIFKELKLSVMTMNYKTENIIKREIIKKRTRMYYKIWNIANILQL